MLSCGGGRFGHHSANTIEDLFQRSEILDENSRGKQVVLYDDRSAAIGRSMICFQNLDVSMSITSFGSISK